jgi:hypothetical protein
MTATRMRYTSKAVTVARAAPVAESRVSSNRTVGSPLRGKEETYQADRSDRATNRDRRRVRPDHDGGRSAGLRRHVRRPVRARPRGARRGPARRTPAGPRRFVAGTVRRGRRCHGDGPRERRALGGPAGAWSDAGPFRRRRGWACSAGCTGNSGDAGSSEHAGGPRSADPGISRSGRDTGARAAAVGPHVATDARTYARTDACPDRGADPGANAPRDAGNDAGAHPETDTGAYADPRSDTPGDVPDPTAAVATGLPPLSPA